MSRSITVRLPFLIGSIEVIHRNPMVLAAVAGEDLLVAVAIDVGDPEGVAVGQGIVDHGARPKLERAGLVFGPDDDLGAVPGFDRGDETPAVGAAEMDLAATPLGSSPGTPATRETLSQFGSPLSGTIGFVSDQLDALVVGRQDIGPSIAGHVDHLDRVQNETRGQFLENELSAWSSFD